MRVTAFFFALQTCFVIFSSAFVSSERLHAAIVVRSEQSVYYVTPGQTFDLHIHIDADDQTLGSTFEPVPSGLFSYGVAATFPVGLATVPSTAQVVPAPALNYFGLSGGAFKQVLTDSARVKGNIDVVGGVAYTGSLLATIQITNLAPASSSYWIDLDEWRTLGANEQIFITGSGAVLDTNPSTDLFMSALVIVVPEPSGFCLTLVSVLCAALGARRGCRAVDGS